MFRPYNGSMRILMFTGKGGVGKTSLAARWLQIFEKSSFHVDDQTLRGPERNPPVNQFMFAIQMGRGDDMSCW